jgi:peptide/nickel transport system ATP-binding protein
MYAGAIVETGNCRDIITSPAHPYTRGLLESCIGDGLAIGKRLPAIRGAPPDLASLPPGCSFAPRCRQAKPVCEQAMPPDILLGNGHRARCVLAAPAAAE